VCPFARSHQPDAADLPVGPTPSGSSPTHAGSTPPRVDLAGRPSRTLTPPEDSQPQRCNFKHCNTSRFPRT